MQENRLQKVLLVEDDENHALLVMRSIESSGVKVLWVGDGELALDYLFHRGAYEDRAESPRPDLILLDLRLPRISGHEVLKDIKNSDLKTIPVVVLTTSSNREDMMNAYRNYANSYLIKPTGFDKFQKMMKDVVVYWLTWNKVMSQADG